MNLQKNNQLGFSLIELMVAVAVIGILTTLAVPNIVAWLPKYHLKHATRDLVSFMREAKMEAVKNNSSVEVLFHSSVSPGFYFIDSEPKNGSWDTGERRVDLSDYKGGGIEYGFGNAENDWDGDSLSDSSTVTFSGNLLRFSSRGMSNTSGTIFLENKNSDRSFAVTVLTTGSIKIREWTGSAWDE